jgi:predicted AlkP superfamily phosphohydrolase/phosphomutase
MFMSVKQDRTGARTPAQLEQKYSFGKKFSEILGLIDDSRDKVDSVRSELGDQIENTKTMLRRNTSTISAQAEKIITLKDNVSTLKSEVELKVDADEVNIAIKRELENGVDRVETETGYTFDSDGLTISKSGEQMENKIDNTGMYVTRSGDEILTANHKGVNAVNLHASTYLIIGEGDGRSRFEDYGTDRTGCYWIGG